MMHFQDKYNEDLERLQRCDIHYVTPDLRISQNFVSGTNFFVSASSKMYVPAPQAK